MRVTIASPTMPQEEHNQDEEHEPTSGEPSTEERPLISYRGAMWAYAALAAACFLTLHGDAMYVALIIIGALAIKTWLADAKRRME